MFHFDGMDIYERFHFRLEFEVKWTSCFIGNRPVSLDEIVFTDKKKEDVKEESESISFKHEFKHRYTTVHKQILSFWCCIT